MAGRPPRNRAGDYFTDAQQLIHLSRAINVDSTLSPEWREKARQLVLDAAGYLMSVDTNRLVRKAKGA